MMLFKNIAMNQSKGFLEKGFIIFCLALLPICLQAQHGSGGLAGMGAFFEGILILIFIMISIGIVFILSLISLVRKKGSLTGMLIGAILLVIVNEPSYVLKDYTMGAISYWV